MDDSLITPALQARVGVPSEPISFVVTPGLVKRLRDMLGELAAPDQRVPPAVLNMPDAGRELSPLSDLPEGSLVTGDEWEFQRHVEVGEELTAVNRLAHLAERFGGRLGHQLNLRHEWTFTDTTGETVGIDRRSMAYYRRGGVRPREETPPEFRPPAPPLEPVPGADPRLAVPGDPITSRLLTPSLENVVRYCAVTYNITPIFFDPEVARANGLPGTIVPGPLKLSLLAELVRGWAGPDALVEQIRVAHRRPDVPRRPILLGGSVTGVEDSADGRRVECEVWIMNADGERSAVGAATVRLAASG